MMNTNEKTMTTREFYNAVIAHFEGETVNFSDADMIAFADAQIEKLDAANAKRKEKTDKKSLEKAATDAPLLDALAAALTDEPKTATDLKDVIGANVQKTSYLLRALVKAERAKSQDVKIKGKGTQKGYIAC